MGEGGGGRHKTLPQNFLHVFNPSCTKSFLSGGEKIGFGKAATKQLIPSLSHLIPRTGKSVSILAQNAEIIRKMTQEQMVFVLCRKRLEKTLDIQEYTRFRKIEKNGTFSEIIVEKSSSKNYFKILKR